MRRIALILLALAATANATHAVKPGDTDKTFYARFAETSDGTYKTDITATDIDLYYWRQGSTVAAKVDATALGSLDAAHSDNQVYEVDDTGFPGLWRVDWPDAAFAAGADWVVLSCVVSGAHTVNLMVTIDTPVNVEQIEAGDPTDAINGEVDTALSDINLDHLMKTGDATLANIVADNTALAHLMATGADISDYSNASDSLESLRDHIGDGTNLTEAGGTGDQLSAVPWNSDWDAEVESEVEDGLGDYGASTHTAANVWAVATRSLTHFDEDDMTIDINGTTIGTCTTNTDMRGTDNAMLATEDGSSFTAVPWNAAWDAEVQSECADALTAFGASTFDPTADKVYLGNGAHGGAAASITLADYSDFTGAGGGDATAANQATMLALLQHGTYGLSAINSDIDTLLARITAARAAYLDAAISTRATPADVEVIVP